MNKFSIAVHGGAGPDSDFIRKNKSGYEAGVKAAAEAGSEVLKDGGSAMEAVEKAVKSLEDNPLFNSGRGSSLNAEGKVEMDAAIMDGNTRQSGAASMVKGVKNPIVLAKFVMEKTSHVYLSGSSVLSFAEEEGIDLMPEAYFVTDHQVEEYLKISKQKVKDAKKVKVRGTVGAVACDIKGNVAAATSTGGTSGCMSGRIGDSCIIGAGCYADNKSCAASATGDGEFIINRVIGHSVAMLMELKKCTVQEACDLVIHAYNKDVKGDLGIIAADHRGNIGIAFNSARMHRAWQSSAQDIKTKIYK